MYNWSRLRGPVTRVAGPSTVASPPHTAPPPVNYPAPPPNAPIEPLYVIPMSHLLDPPYNTMASPPLWTTPGGGAAPTPTTPGGPVNSIQYNSNGAFGGDAGLTWANTNFSVTGYILLIAPGAGSSASLIAKNPNNATRWTAEFINQDAESGSDTGSNFQIKRWRDAGPPPIACLTISRATGVVSLATGLNLQPATNAAPQDGDLWYDGTHLNFRHGTTTTVLV